MFYEIRKFYKTPAIILLSMVAIIVSMVMPIFFIYDYESYDYIEEDEVVVKGIEAIERRKEQVKKTSGIIRTEVLNEALRLYKSETSFDKAYISVEKKYPELYQLLRVAYAPYLGDNIFEVKSISSADDYYNKNVDKIRSKIAFYGATTITREEAQEAIHRGATIQKPYKYEFVDQWAILMKGLIFTYAVIVLLAIVIANQLFSFEKEKNMAMILHATGNNKLTGIGYNKIRGMVIYLSTLFVLCTSISSGIIYGLAGASGWNTQIQVMPEFFTSIYSWTFGDLYIWFVAIAWLSIISIAMVGSVFNSIIQKTYTSFILTVCIIALPLLIQHNDVIPVAVKKLLWIQPINGINLLSYMDSLHTFNLGSVRVLQSTMLAIVAGFLLIIGGLLSGFCFSKRLTK